MGFPGGSEVKNTPANAGDTGSIPGREDALEEGMATTPVFLSGEFAGQRSLAGYSPRRRRESDTTEQLNSTNVYIYNRHTLLHA